MTSEHNARDRRLEDQLYVDALLAEAGFLPGSADDDGLRDALLRLRSFRTTEVPVPCAELVALMGATDVGDSDRGDVGPVEADPMLAEVIPLAGRPRRHPRKKRAVLTSLAVAASLGIAGGAAAGNETVRRHAAGTIDTIVRSFAPPAFAPAQPPVPADTDPAVPAVDHPAEPADAPGPASGVVPSDAAPSGAAQPVERSAPDGATVANRPGSPAAAAGNAAAGKANPGETEQAPARPVPPSSAGQDVERTRDPADGTPPWAGHGASPTAPTTAAPATTDLPEPKVSRGTSPR